MRCDCCNVILTPQESTRKFASGAYVDMCNTCLATISEDVVVKESRNFDKEDNYDDEPSYE